MVLKPIQFTKNYVQTLINHRKRINGTRNQRNCEAPGIKQMHYLWGKQDMLQMFFYYLRALKQIRALIVSPLAKVFASSNIFYCL